MGVLTQFWSPRGSRFLLLKYERQSRSEVPFTVGVIPAQKFRKNSKNIKKNDHFSEIRLKVINNFFGQFFRNFYKNPKFWCSTLPRKKSDFISLICADTINKRHGSNVKNI